MSIVSARQKLCTPYLSHYRMGQLSNRPTQPYFRCLACHPLQTKRTFFQATSSTPSSPLVIYVTMDVKCLFQHPLSPSEKKAPPYLSVGGITPRYFGEYTKQANPLDIFHAATQPTMCTKNVPFLTQLLTYMRRVSDLLKTHGLKP
jgi:hypothetical protein